MKCWLEVLRCRTITELPSIFLVSRSVSLNPFIIFYGNKTRVETRKHQRHFYFSFTSHACGIIAAETTQRKKLIFFERLIFYVKSFCISCHLENILVGTCMHSRLLRRAALTCMKQEKFQHCTEQCSPEELLPFTKQIWREFSNIRSQTGQVLWGSSLYFMWGITGVSVTTEFGEFRSILLKETRHGAKQRADVAAQSDAFQRSC